LLLALSITGVAGIALAATQRGTGGPDKLVGTRHADRLLGRAGRDKLAGGGGTDTLIGGKGRDHLLGGRGPDTLDGGRGRDGLRGGRGDDILNGGRGRDNLRGGRGDDQLLAGPGGGVMTGGPGSDEFNEINGELVGAEGNDRILARDGTQDAINCGPGNDVAVVDRSEEGVFDCETVIEPSPSAAAR
jgi:Ca2+-binding RTX toxin-like protein